MFKYFKKKTSEIKEKYTNLLGNGGEAFEAIKTNFKEDKERIKSLQDAPETAGLTRLKKFRLKIMPIMCVFAIVLLFNDFFAVSLVKGSSMVPTLKDNQFVFITRKEAIDYGDVVVVADNEKYPNAQTVVKRVIAFGGDKIKCVNGIVYLNGEALDEPYAYLAKTEDFKEVTVPQGQVFIMGDNREHSSDSREVGTVSMYNVLGKVKGYNPSEHDYVNDYSKATNKITG